MVESEVMKQETVPTDVSEIDVIPKQDVFQEKLDSFDSF